MSAQTCKLNVPEQVKRAMGMSWLCCTCTHSSEGTRVMSWSTTYGSPHGVLHFCTSQDSWRGQESSHIPNGDAAERNEEGQAKARWYQALQLRARNLRCWKDSFGLAPREIQAGVSLGTKVRRKPIQGKCCTFIYTHRESMSRLHTHLPGRSPITVGHLTSQLLSAWLPRICLAYARNKISEMLNAIRHTPKKNPKPSAFK